MSTLDALTPRSSCVLRYLLPVAIALSVVAASAPAAAQAVIVAGQADQTWRAPTVTTEGQAYTPAPARRSHGNLGFLISGGVFLGIGWLLNGIGSLPAGTHPSLFGSSSAGDPGWEVFRGVAWIPVVGPLIQLAVKPTEFGQDGWGTWLLLDDLLLQAGGLVLLIVGLTMPGDAPATTAGSWRIAPSLSPGRAGLSVTGNF